jgi:hypothetical protein
VRKKLRREWFVVQENPTSTEFDAEICIAQEGTTIRHIRTKLTMHILNVRQSALPGIEIVNHNSVGLPPSHSTLPMKAE